MFAFECSLFDGVTGVTHRSNGLHYNWEFGARPAGEVSKAASPAEA